MRRSSLFCIVLIVILLILPIAGENVGRSFGGDVTAIVGTIAGLFCSVLGGFVWVRFAQTDPIAMIAGFVVASATVQSWSLATANFLSPDMQLITTIAFFLLAWSSFNKAFGKFVVDHPEESDFPTSTNPQVDPPTSELPQHSNE